jgi:hypothetical protein
MKLFACSFLVVVFALSTLGAQDKAQSSSTPAQPSSASETAKAADVASIDAILGALYDVISGPPTQKRDWTRMKSLFVPDARLIPAGMHPDGKIGVHLLSVDEYINRAEPFMAKEGFFENEVARRTEQFGNIAHIWSTYESRHTKGEKPFARGINSIQLVNDGQRWWVVNIFWQGESPEHPLPEKYLQTVKP